MCGAAQNREREMVPYFADTFAIAVQIMWLEVVLHYGYKCTVLVGLQCQIFKHPMPTPCEEAVCRDLHLPSWFDAQSTSQDCCRFSYMLS